MFRDVNLGILFLDFLVDIAQGRRDPYSWSNREAQPCFVRGARKVSLATEGKSDCKETGKQTDRVLVLRGKTPQSQD